MNTVEKYYIHNEKKKGTQINNSKVNENSNFDILVHYNVMSHRQHYTPHPHSLTPRIN